MVIFNSYFSLPEGRSNLRSNLAESELTGRAAWQTPRQAAEFIEPVTLERQEPLCRVFFVGFDPLKYGKLESINGSVEI